MEENTAEVKIGDKATKQNSSEQTPDNGVTGFQAKDTYPEHSIEEWNEWITKTLPNFEGNIANAATLLHSTSQGVKYICDKLSKRGLSFKKPGLVILESEPENAGSKIFHSDGNIFIVKDNLEASSKRNPFEEILFVKRDFSSVETTTSDHFGVTGVEEAHHAIYRGTKVSNGDSLIKPRESKIEEYDALQHEFRALLQQRAFAVDNSLHPKTIESLDKRIDEARIIRRRK